MTNKQSIIRKLSRICHCAKQTDSNKQESNSARNGTPDTNVVTDAVCRHESRVSVLMFRQVKEELRRKSATHAYMTES